MKTCFSSFFPHGWTALVGLSLLIVEVSRSHSETLNSVRLLRIGPSQRPLTYNTNLDRPIAETSTLQHKPGSAHRRDLYLTTQTWIGPSQRPLPYNTNLDRPIAETSTLQHKPGSANRRDPYLTTQTSIGPSQRPLTYNTNLDWPIAETSTLQHKHSKETNIHTLGGVRNHKTQQASDSRPTP